MVSFNLYEKLSTVQTKSCRPDLSVHYTSFEHVSRSSGKSALSRVHRKPGLDIGLWNSPSQGPATSLGGPPLSWKTLRARRVSENSCAHGLWFWCAFLTCRVFLNEWNKSPLELPLVKGPPNAVSGQRVTALGCVSVTALGCTDWQGRLAPSRSPASHQLRVT